MTEAEWALLGGELQRHPVWAPPVVLIKRGPRGARLLTPVRYLDIPAQFKGRPVDTLGAGDVFAAGYLAGLLIGLSLPQAVRLGRRPRLTSRAAPDERATRTGRLWKGHRRLRKHCS